MELAIGSGATHCFLALGKQLLCVAAALVSAMTLYEGGGSSSVTSTTQCDLYFGVGSLLLPEHSVGSFETLHVGCSTAGI